MIVLRLPSSILSSNISFLRIDNGINSIVTDGFNVSLLPDNSPLRLRLKLLEFCVRHQEASSILAPLHSIIIQFLPDILDHILGWRWEVFIQRKVAASTTHILQGTSSIVGWLAMRNEETLRWVAYIHC